MTVLPTEIDIWDGGRRVEVDPFTGASGFRYDIPLTAGRSGFTPHIDLRYDSRLRNSVFGWGWNLSGGVIARRNHPRVPRYGDDDVFEIDGAELTPALRSDGATWVDDRFDIGEYEVQRYRRRSETSHDRIERWFHRPTEETHWRVVDGDNVSSVYGLTDDSRQCEGRDVTKTAYWHLTERFDDRGNIMRFVYKPEDLAGVDLGSTVESHRGPSSTAGAMLYPKRILYANASPHDRSEWHFEVVFDYGEHDGDLPTSHENREWKVRPDPYSDHRAGFETRVWRRCERIVMFHNFAELGEGPKAVWSVDLDYDTDFGHSALRAITRTGLIERADGSVQRRSEPAVTMTYQQPTLDDAVRTVESDVIVGALLDERSSARWIDLHQEKLPGLALRVGGSWCFVRNYGGARFGEPEVVNDTSLLEPEEPEIIELADLRKQSGTSHARAYQPMATLRATANVAHDDPYVGYLDLNGDNADDVIVADEHVIRWYPSQSDEGFGDPVVLKLDIDGHVKPSCLYADERLSLWVADMNGDGLYDLVRVRSGEVSYWPHNGRGRFGPRIVVTSSPVMPVNRDGEGRLLLADLTGTGTADVVWIDNNEIRYWQNFNGTSFGPVRRASAPGIEPGALGTSTVDLFGRGTECVVWIDRSTGTPALRYISPVGDRKPLLLSSVSNGRGGETRCAYITSAEQRRRDRADGLDQLAELPISVPVVEQIEFRDATSGVRSIDRFVFRHGAFDDQTQGFIGFAYAEQWQSGAQELYDQPGLFAHEPAMPVLPERRSTPTLQKMWRHTGVMFEGEDLALELAMDYFADPGTRTRNWLTNELPDNERVSDQVNVHRALTGRLLRNEFYDVSNGTASVPLRVAETNYVCREVQPGRSGCHGSVDCHRSQSLTIDYDSEGLDPRIEHELALEIDEFGTTTVAANINYSRRNGVDRDQTTRRIVVDERKVLNQGNQSTWHRLRVPRELSQWEIVGGSAPIGELYEAAEIRHLLDELPVLTPGAGSNNAHRRILVRQRWHYWSNDLSRTLTNSDLESRALIARVDQLALSDAMVRQFFDDRDVNAIMRYEGGYEREGDLWWAVGETSVYSKARFYLPVARRDGVGRQTNIRYDSAALVVQEVEDAYANTTRYHCHRRTMQTWQTVDANNNVIASRFDPLGHLLSRAVMGKPQVGRGDVLALDVDEASVNDDPTAVVTHGTNKIATNEPNWVRLRHRIEHRDDKARLRDEIHWRDSEGRSLARAVSTGNDMWRISNFTLRDSLGRPVEVAPAFISEKPWPAAEVVAIALRQARRYRYDALGRLTRTDLPDGTYTTADYTPWTVVESDANDNILDTTWYSDRQGSMHGRAADFAERALRQMEGRAAAMAALHADTPTHSCLDPCGRVVAVTQSVNAQQTLTIRFERNAQGESVAWIDRRGLEVKRVSLDLLGRCVRIDHADAGVSQLLLSSTGEVLRHWDAQGNGNRYRYDALGRCTHRYLRTGTGPERLVERTVWGGGDVSIPDAQQHNLIGRRHVTLSSFGVETVDTVDLAGRVGRRSFMAADSNEDVDWMPVDEVANTTQLFKILTNGPKPMVGSRYEIIDTHDALGNLVSRRHPDVATVNRRFDIEGRLVRLFVGAADGSEVKVIEDVQYDTAGRVAVLRFGNGAWVRRSYNAQGRVSYIGAAAKGSEENLQDLSIVYDPNGNVISVSDDSDLLAAYTYDGLDRLVKVEGRETVDRGSDNETVRNFVDDFVLDAEANVVEYRRRSSGDEMGVNFEYESGCNQLRVVKVVSGPATDVAGHYQYDEAGNLIIAPDHHLLRWSESSRLTQMDTDSSRTTLSYAADGRLRRKRTVSSEGTNDVIYIDGCQMRTTEKDGVGTRGHVLELMVDGIPVAVFGEHNAVGALRYQLVDHANSTMMELDEAGNVDGRWAFSVGGLLSGGATDRGDIAFGFKGWQLHADLGLYRHDGRWFSPALGRYLQPGESVRSAANLYLDTDVSQLPRSL